MANGEAIGLIETKGIVAAVEACDAALKAANVNSSSSTKSAAGWSRSPLRAMSPRCGPRSMPAQRPAGRVGEVVSRPRHPPAAPRCGEDGMRK